MRHEFRRGVFCRIKPINHESTRFGGILGDERFLNLVESGGALEGSGYGHRLRFLGFAGWRSEG